MPFDRYLLAQLTPPLELEVHVLPDQFPLDRDLFVLHLLQFHLDALAL